MSSNAEFIQNWNEIIRYKMKESDLCQPSELFLTNVLLHYIEKFNFDLSLLLNAKDSEISENRRKFKLSLCAYIDYLYKSGNEASNSFLYYDLISPSPKKTKHLLKYLLNYLFFYNVMKEEIIGPTEDKIRQRSELHDKKSALLIENNKNQFLAKSITKSLEDHRIMLPKLIQKLNNLEIKEREQNDMKKCLEDSLENHKTQLMETKKKERNGLYNIVSDEETNNLFIKKEEIQKLISQQIEIEHSVKITDSERTHSISQLEPLIIKLEKAMIIVNLTEISKSKKLKETYQKLTERVKEQNLNNNAITVLNEKDMKILENLDIFLSSKIEDIKKFKQLSYDEVLNKEKTYKSENLSNVKLNSEFNALIAELMEQEQIHNIILSSAEKLFHHLFNGRSLGQ